MAAEDKWIIFLERNPQFYELSKGDFYIRFLERIREGAKSFSDLMAMFPEIEEKDMRIIMDALLKVKVVSKLAIGPKIFFTITSDGKKLLNAYSKTRKFFST